MARFGSRPRLRMQAIYTSVTRVWVRALVTLETLRVVLLLLLLRVFGSFFHLFRAACEAVDRERERAAEAPTIPKLHQPSSQQPNIPPPIEEPTWGKTSTRRKRL